MKRAFILLPIIFSPNAFADETLFSCLTEKNNIISLINKGDVVEYQVASAKTNKITFSFEQPIGNINLSSSVEQGVTQNVYQISNNGYRYDLVVWEKENNKLPIGVEAKDPSGKTVSTNRCKEFIDFINSDTDNKAEENTSSNEPVSNQVYEEGMYRVGRDIPAGEYKLTTTNKERGHFTIYSSSERDSVIAVDTFKNSTYLTVKEGQYLELRNSNAQLVE